MLLRTPRTIKRRPRSALLTWHWSTPTKCTSSGNDNSNGKKKKNIHTDIANKTYAMLLRRLLTRHGNRNQTPTQKRLPSKGHLPGTRLSNNQTRPTATSKIVPYSPPFSTYFRLHRHVALGFFYQHDNKPSQTTMWEANSNTSSIKTSSRGYRSTPTPRRPSQKNSTRIGYNAAQVVWNSVSCTPSLPLSISSEAQVTTAVCSTVCVYPHTGTKSISEGAHRQAPIHSSIGLGKHRCPRQLQV